MSRNVSRRETLGVALALGASSVVGCATGSFTPPSATDPGSQPPGSDDGGTSMIPGDMQARNPLDKLTPPAPLQLSPDGQIVAALGFGEVIFWDTSSGTISSRTVFDSDVSEFAINVPWSWRGPVVALADWWDETVSVNLVSAATGSPMSKMVVTSEDKAVSPWALALSPDGSLLASSLGDGTIRVHTTADGTEVSRVEPRDTAIPDTGHVPQPSYGHDGTLVLSSDFVQCPVQFWSGDGARLLRLPPQPSEPYFRFQLTPDAAHCAMFRRIDGTIRHAELWDATTFELLSSHPAPVKVTSAALHPAGTHLAWTGGGTTADAPASIDVLDFSTGEVTHLVTDRFRPRSLVYTPDGKSLLAMDPREGIRAWDHGTNSLRQVFELPE